ncbi:MAG: Rieske 2Fe-2S domain-containing protein, partial [Pseudomonadota bacterium]
MDMQASPNPEWHKAKPLNLVRDKKMLLARVAGKQIALFDTESGIKACDNRCPHEGYPLSEGSLSGECTLTCNWHNWKFNLESGENFYGGDRLRIYPVEVRGDDVWVDIAEPPYDIRYSAITKNLRDAFDDHSYDRIAREIARLIQLGADPFEALRLCIDWSWQRMEFGWTHAYAGMADWLQLYNETDDREIKLACLLESVAHAAFDVLREPVYAFSDDRIDYEESVFLNAIENEDEATACASIRGAIAAGLGFEDLEEALSTAALAHYNDFGHSLIYVSKVGYLIEQLGTSVAEPLLLSLVRGIVFASREDRIPEFRDYAPTLDQWGQPSVGSSDQLPSAKDWRGAGISKSLTTTLACSNAKPADIYRELLLSNAINMLS